MYIFPGQQCASQMQDTTHQHPQQRDNAAILEINHLAKNPKWEALIKFFYDNNQRKLTWIDYRLPIQWLQVV